MWRGAFVITLCLGSLLNSCHGQQNDFLETLKDLLNTTESHHASAKIYQEQMFTTMEDLNKNVEKSEQRLLEMLEKTEFKLSTRIEAVEKELRDRSTCTTVENTLREGLSNVTDEQHVAVEWMKNLREIQSQVLQMKNEMIQRFGDFVDQFGNNQSEATAERLRYEWTNFSRNIFSEVPNLHRRTMNASNNGNLNTAAQGCHDLLKEGIKKNGVYQLHPEGQNSTSFSAYCDMTEDGGGWTVILWRDDYGDDGTDFYRNWTEYRDGFGNLKREFWLGNEKIHSLTSTGEFQLRVTLKAFDGDVLRINYDYFTVDSEDRNYSLDVGVADLPKEGAALHKHNGYPFSTWDRQNGISVRGLCAEIWKTGWWFHNCFSACLTGYNPALKSARIRWEGWKNGDNLKAAEMKIRPKNFQI